jgi:hypothetical protein
MLCEDNLMEEVNEVICLSCEVKIVQIFLILSSCNLFYSWYDSLLGSRKNNLNIFICINRQEFESEEMFLNK